MTMSREVQSISRSALARLMSAVMFKVALSHCSHKTAPAFSHLLLLFKSQLQ
jgi:hypothetical protein